MNKQNKITKLQLEDRLNTLNHMADFEYGNNFYFTLQPEIYEGPYELWVTSGDNKFRVCKDLTRTQLWHQMTGICKGILTEKKDKGVAYPRHGLVDYRKLEHLDFDSPTFLLTHNVEAV